MSAPAKKGAPQVKGEKEIQEEMKQAKVPEFVAKLAETVNMDPAGYSYITRSLAKDSVGRALTDAEYAYFMSIAAKYELDPLTREIYAFAKRGGGVQPIFGYDGWIKIANKNPDYNGLAGPFYTQIGEDYECKMVLYRKSLDHPIEMSCRLSEFKRDTPTWKTMPLHMMRVRTTCQLFRLGFGITEGLDPDEAEKQIGLRLLVSRMENDRGNAQEVEIPKPESVVPSPNGGKAPAPWPKNVNKHAVMGAMKGMWKGHTSKGEDDLGRFLADVYGVTIDTIGYDLARAIMDRWSDSVYDSKNKKKIPKDGPPDISDIKGWIGEDVPEEEVVAPALEQPMSSDGPILGWPEAPADAEPRIKSGWTTCRELAIKAGSFKAWSGFAAFVAEALALKSPPMGPEFLTADQWADLYEKIVGA